MKTYAFRSACLSLVFLLAFASYRPAINLLSIAALAKGEEDGAMTSGKRPRPTRQQSTLTAERAERRQVSEREPADNPRRTLCALTRVTIPAASEVRLWRLLLQPDYLNPYLPAQPHNHLSPPA